MTKRGHVRRTVLGWTRKDFATKAFFGRASRAVHVDIQKCMEISRTLVKTNRKFCRSNVQQSQCCEMRAEQKSDHHHFAHFVRISKVTFAIFSKMHQVLVEMSADCCRSGIEIRTLQSSIRCCRNSTGGLQFGGRKMQRLLLFPDIFPRRYFKKTSVV